MRLPTILLAVAALAGSALVVAAEPAKPGQETRSIGKNKYIITVGTKYSPDKTAKVMILLHGNAHSAEQYKSYLKNEADRYGWIYLAPQAPGGSWKPGDDKFIFEMIDDVKKLCPNIDDTHMLIVGVYENGSTAGEIALKNPKRFNALILLAAAPPSLNEAELAAAKSVGVWVAHGEKDGLNSISRTEEFVEKAKKAGLKVEFTKKADVTDDMNKVAPSPTVYIKWWDELAVADIKAAYEKAMELAKADKFAEAAAAFKGVVAMGGTTQFAKDAQAELDKIDKLGNAKVDEALDLVKKDDFTGAAKLLQEVEKKFGGLAAAERAKKEVAGLKDNPRLKELLGKQAQEEKEKAAEKEFAAAEAKEKAKDYEGALTAYRTVAANYAGTAFEEKAKAKIAEFEGNAEIMKAVGDAKAAGEVKGLMSKADNYKKNKMWEKALEAYKEIEKKYPGTPSAAEAAKKRQECEKALK